MGQIPNLDGALLQLRRPPGRPGRPSIIVVHMTRVGLPDYGRRAHERHADNRMVLIVRSAYVVTECYIDYCDLDIYKRVLRKPPGACVVTGLIHDRAVDAIVG